MEPGEGISCAEGDSGPPRDGCEPSWARPCEASGALFLSNGGSGGGHETCALWPPPAPFGYFPARGKYLVRPQADETSHKELISCGRQGKTPPCFFCCAKSFASAEATKGLSGRPLETFGVPPLEMDGGSTKNGFFVEGRGKPRLAFFVSLRVSPLRRRPKGFPVALWKPSGFQPLRGMGATKNGFFVGDRGKPRLAFCFAKGFASAEATKGLSGRPLETFGVPTLERDGGYKKWIFCGRQGKATPCFPCITSGFAPPRKL